MANNPLAHVMAGAATSAALARARAENLELSAAVLEFSGRLEEIVKARAVDRLLNAVLLRHLTDNDHTEIPIAVVDAVRAEIRTSRSLQVMVSKDQHRGVWKIVLEPVDASAPIDAETNHKRIL